MTKILAFPKKRSKDKAKCLDEAQNSRAFLCVFDLGTSKEPNYKFSCDNLTEQEALYMIEILKHHILNDGLIRQY